MFGSMVVSRSPALPRSSRARLTRFAKLDIQQDIDGAILGVEVEVSIPPSRGVPY